MSNKLSLDEAKVALAEAKASLNVELQVYEQYPRSTHSTRQSFNLSEAKLTLREAEYEYDKAFESYEVAAAEVRRVDIGKLIEEAVMPKDHANICNLIRARNKAEILLTERMDLLLQLSKNISVLEINISLHEAYQRGFQEDHVLSGMMKQILRKMRLVSDMEYSVEVLEDHQTTPTLDESYAPGECSSCVYIIPNKTVSGGIIDSKYDICNLTGKKPAPKPGGCKMWRPRENNDGLPAWRLRENNEKP